MSDKKKTFLSRQIISRTVASDTPPPPQRVAIPRVFPRFCMAWRRVTMIRHPVEPTGWPRPTPEPLTLVISRFRPSSRSQPRYWAAKASLTSMSSKSESLRPERSRRFRTAGTGLSPMTEGWQPPRPTALIRARGVTPSSPAFSADMMIMALAPSLTPEELPRRDLARLGDESRGQGGQRVHGQARAEMLVLVEDDRRLSPLLGDGNGDDLTGKVALCRGPFGVVVAPQGHRVDLLAGKAVHLGDELRRDAHDVGLAPEGFDDAALLDGTFFQARDEVGTRMEAMDDVVHEDLVLEPAAPARGRHGIGDPRHVFHAARQDDVRHAGLDHGHAGDDGLHPGDADPVDGGGRHRFGDSRHEGRDPGDVQGVCGLPAAAEADVVDEGRVYLGPLDGLLHHDTPQGGAVEVTQRAAEGSNGGPAGRYDNDIFHSFLLKRQRLS